MVCKSCGIDKPEDSFYRDKKGYASKTCKACTIHRVSEWQKANVTERKEYMKHYHSEHKNERKKQDDLYRDRLASLKTPCVKCGEKRLYIIDFHHVDPSKKSFNVPRKTAKQDFSVIEAEARKCVCLCRNCHAEFHHYYGLKPNNPTEALREYLSTEFVPNGTNIMNNYKEDNIHEGN